VGAEIGDFDDLVRRYRRELHVYCYRMLGSFDEAEDHVQEVMLRAWHSREGFQGQSGVRTWLYRVAANACLEGKRSRWPSWRRFSCCRRANGPC
jgi:RNA polymerase sigma-70 factor, ECF subfamily